MLKTIIHYGAILGIVTSSMLFGSTANAQSKFIQIDQRGGTVCALRDDNAAFCNSLFVSEVRTPSDLPPVQKVAASNSTSCVLLVSGELRCFGTGAFDLTAPPDSGMPYQDLSIHTAHACAINSNNGLECWGVDSNNRLDAPAGEFSQVSVSVQNACAVDLAGGVSCWGANDRGTSDVPADLPAATKVVAGLVSSCALLTDGNIQCWGRAIDPIVGPFIDMDMYAFGIGRQGSAGVCGTDQEGGVECKYLDFDGSSSTERTDFEQPEGIGNSSVSLSSFGSGCYINSTGANECFGSMSSTMLPTINDNGGTEIDIPATTGLRSLVYSGTTIELFWDAPRDAFNVEGHEISRNGEVVEFTQNLSSFLFTDLEPNEAETFAVRRVDARGGAGEFSNTVTVTAQNGEPNLPPDPNAYVQPTRQFEDSFMFALDVCSGFAEVFWFANTPTPDIDGYEVHRDGNLIAFVEDDFYDDRDITPGRIHLYEVIAIDLDDPTRFHGTTSNVLEIIDDPESCL